MQKLKIFCDGGARGNPGPAATGFVVKTASEKVLVEKGEAIGRATNNIAEYQAVIHALTWLIENPASRDNFSFNFYLDSLLVVQQLKGIYKVKNEKLRLLLTQAKMLENKLAKPVFYSHIPRNKNEEADRLVNTALDNLPQSLLK